MMAAGFKDNDDVVKQLTKTDFYVKHVLGSYFDSTQTPILKETDVYTGEFIKKFNAK